MINILCLFSWTTWLLIVFIIIFLFWLVWGGKQEYEFVGVKPLTTPTIDSKSFLNYQPDINMNLIEIPNRKINVVQTNTGNKGEDIVYEVLCHILESPVMRNVRPDFLRNPKTGKNLELDCYNEEYAIAAEYNGIQHYKYPSAFHSSEQQFYDQVRRDKLKKRLCDESGVYLIPIPYWVDIYDSEDQHIKNKDAPFKPIFVPREVRYQRIYTYLYNKISEYFQIIFPQNQNETAEDSSIGWDGYDPL